MQRRFVWDRSKAAANELKHGVSFEEATSAFDDPDAVTVYDEEHSRLEDRYILLGMSPKFRVLFVVHAEVTPEVVRIISARRATRAERDVYEKKLDT